MTNHISAWSHLKTVAIALGALILLLPTQSLLHTAILFALLAAIAWIDWRTYRIPNILSLTLLVTGLLVSFATDPAGIYLHVLSALLGYGFFRLVDVGYVHLRGRTGLGMGDAKLFGAIGAWLGPEGMVPALFIAAISALIYGLYQLIVSPNGGNDKIPFGPFLAIGAFVIWGWSHILT